MKTADGMISMSALRQGKKELPFRQIHMDFHTSPFIEGVGEGFDAAEFAAVLKKTEVNSINLFAKCHHGMYYYPTKIGTMHPGLKFDLLGAQIDACRREGIRTCVYTTVVWNEDWADRHPEWMQVSIDGILGVKKPFEARWRWLCSNNEEHREYLRNEFREIYELYKPDGFWIDIILTAKCICKTCTAEMRRMGLDPSSLNDVQRHDRLVQIKFIRDMYKYLHEMDAGLDVYFNAHPAEFDLINDEECSSVNKRRNMTFIDIESLPSGLWGYSHFPILANYVNKLDQEYAMMNGKFHKIWGDFGSLRNLAALEYECFRAIANGAKCCVGDQLHPSGMIDRTVYSRIGEVYRQVKAKEEWCSGTAKVSQIGVYASNLVLDSDNLSDEGVYRMLTEGHFLYDVIDYTSDIEQYGLVILPDKVKLPGYVADKISAYLKCGGKLLLTGKSGLDEAGKAFALDAFGVEYVSEDVYCPRYAEINEDKFPSIPPMDYVMYERGEVVKIMGVSDCGKGAENSAGSDAGSSTRVMAYLTDPYFNRTYDRFCSHSQTPPDRHLMGTERKPFIVRNGNVIYIANPLFRDYALNGNKVFKDLIVSCIYRLLNDPIIKTNLPSTAEVTLRKQGDRLVLHLLHYIPHRRCKALDTIEDRIPLYNAVISVRMVKKPSKVYLAPQGDELKFSFDSAYAHVTVSEINGHQMLVYEFN